MPLQERTRRKHWRYDRSRKGVARSLRAKYGYSPSDSNTLAKLLLHPYTRCSICGVPQRILLYFLRKGGPFIRGDSRVNRRLTVDHIDPWGPSTLTNSRPLCYPCNNLRGPAINSDDHVLREVARLWQFRLNLKQLWWLNTSPGIGGRPTRGLRHMKDAE